MADYAIGRTGGSLRDALNAIMPMTGMGEYSTMFPPQLPPNTGAEPTGQPPVPVPRQRPPLQAGTGGPLALPPGGVTMPPNYPAAQQLYQGLQANQGQMPPGNYAQRLGLVR